MKIKIKAKLIDGIACLTFKILDSTDKVQFKGFVDHGGDVNLFDRNTCNLDGSLARNCESYLQTHLEDCIKKSDYLKKVLSIAEFVAHVSEPAPLLVGGSLLTTIIHDEIDHVNDSDSFESVKDIRLNQIIMLTQRIGGYLKGKERETFYTDCGLTSDGSIEV